MGLETCIPSKYLSGDGAAGLWTKLENCASEGSGVESEWACVILQTVQGLLLSPLLLPRVITNYQARKIM